ncbi:hypothetical protein M3Y94_01010500 [Aphelenchoides besseyi]|nr:hypothetical protein M3Y94_01010500 [Aphelenchoides besseyi]
MFRFLIFGFLCFVVFGVADRLDHYDGNAQKVMIEDKDALQIYQKWVDTGLSSLMAAFANRILKKHRTVVANKFGKCSNQADSVPKHAKCIVNLIENKRTEKLKPLNRMSRYGNHSTAQWSGGFRVERKKRSIRVVNRYDIHGTNGGRMTPLGGIAKLIMTSVLEQKNKTQAPRWQETVRRIQVAGEKKRAIQKNLDDESEESLDQLAFRGLKNHLAKEDGTMDVEMLMKNPTKLSEFVNKAKGKKNRKPVEKIMQLLRDGIKLGYAISGQNTTDFDTRTMKLISPRMLGVVPEEKNDDELNVLSPSLFSLHNEGTGVENLTSLSTLLSGMPSRDQQMWLDLIMEASGVNDQKTKIEKEVDEAVQQREEHKNRTEFFDPGSLKDKNGVPLYFTKENATKIGGEFEARKAVTFEKLQLMYTKDQLRELNRTGYVELNNEQLHHLYGPQSPYNNSEALTRFTKKRNLTIHEHIEKDVKTLSEVENFQVRQKDIVLSPILFTSIVLAPQLASATNRSVTILQSLALPWMFVPLVLSPRVLGALVLSPFVFAPIILTPLALHPAILSPGLFNPLVLSPVVLVPFILSPQVFTPHPSFLIRHLVGSPLILSPFVLSPIIASPQALGALILSPYALSPVLFSPLVVFSVILSPSWLSAKKVDIGDKDALQMYQKWVDTGLSSIMAAVANKKIKKHRSSVANKFGKCSNEADTVPKQARCVSKLLRNQIVDTKYHRGQSRRMQQYGYRSREDGWTGAFKQLRRKRNIDNRPRTASSYDLRDASQGHLTPLGGVAKLILESVLAKKKQNRSPTVRPIH